MKNKASYGAAVHEVDIKVNTQKTSSQVSLEQSRNYVSLPGASGNKRSTSRNQSTTEPPHVILSKRQNNDWETLQTVTSPINVGNVGNISMGVSTKVGRENS